MVAEVMVMKLALLNAVHAQSLAVAVKPTLPVPVDADKDTLLEASVNPHETPAWFTVKVCPPIVSVPTRAIELRFAATE